MDYLLPSYIIDYSSIDEDLHLIDCFDDILDKFEWLTKDSEIINMRDMTNNHLMNARRFASPNKLQEIDIVLKERGFK